MKRAKIYIAAAIFLLITVMKLLSPSLASGVRERLLPALQYSVDYREVMIELGRQLGDSDGIRQVFSWMGDTRETEPAEGAQPQRSSWETRYTPATIRQLYGTAGEGLSAVYGVAAEPAEGAQAQAEPIPEPQSEPEPVPTVVAAFLQQQAAFSDYAVPANVSYDMPQLPFSYTTPVTGMTSSGFGYRMHPLANEVKFHYGTDFAAYTGTQIHAFADGTVLACGESDSYGNYIMLDHGNGYQSLYGHCSEVWVSWGETVSCGQVIGAVGATGQVTGPHLHFELMHNDTYLNPAFYLEAA